MSGTHQCDQDMPASQLGENPFFCKVLEGTCLQAEGGGAFHDEVVLRSVAGRPVIVIGCPCRHIGRREGMFGKAGYDHGKGSRAAAV